jgi:hypothetical protein
MVKYIERHSFSTDLEIIEMWMLDELNDCKDKYAIEFKKNKNSMPFKSISNDLFHAIHYNGVLNMDKNISYIFLYYSCLFGFTKYKDEKNR